MLMKNKSHFISIFLSVLFCLGTVQAQTTGFTYQGSLKNGANPASGNHDFEFALFDAVTGGTQLGSTNSVNGVPVTGGVFSVPLNFGSNFPGANRFLEIRVRQSGGGGFTTLTPRQVVTSAPYSVKSLNAETAVNATTATTATNSLQLGGVAANQFVLTGDARLSDARQPLAGSGSYIQNSTTLQPATNFSISGNGTVGGTLNASRMNVTGGFGDGYNIGAQPVLMTMGDNLIVGIGAGENINPGIATANSFFGNDAGAMNTTGVGNSFFGISAGNNNTTGSQNSFFGVNTGLSNTTGSDNSFFGFIAGNSNTTGFENSFFGFGSGYSNTTGSFNSFFGENAGNANTTGINNTYIGASAGLVNTTGNNNSIVGWKAGVNSTGSDNSFVGYLAGQFNTTGSFNSFFGRDAGDSNTTGNNNTIIGYNADVGSGNLNFATAIGAGAVVPTSNTIALGRSNGSDLVRIFGLGAAGSTNLCRNSNNEISTCSSSLRYKMNIAPFGSGLNLIKQLKPITFDWKAGGLKDVGFAAEDVATVNPLFVTYNTKGEVEGVKYDRITTVLVNAVNEQQTNIEAQQKQIDEQKEIIKRQQELLDKQQSEIKKQQVEVDALKKFVCLQNPTAELCQPKN